MGTAAAADDCSKAADIWSRYEAYVIRIGVEDEEEVEEEPKVMVICQCLELEVPLDNARSAPKGLKNKRPSW